MKRRDVAKERLDPFRLGREINPSVYTAKEFKRKLSAKHPFILNVLKNPKVYLLGGEHELAELGKK